MRIRERFILTNTIVLAGLISTVVLSLWSLNEYRSISATIQQGLRLISDARRVHVLMKDMLIGAFTPETYGELKDIVHLEGINTTRRVWQDAVDDFGGAFEAFMTVPRLQRLVAGDAVLKDEYAVARRLSDRAFEMVISLEERMTVLERRGLLGRDDLYYQIQRSNDPALIGFFSEIRESSFFLTNTFESFLHHFVGSLQAEAERLQRRVIMLFVALASVIALVSLVVPYLLARVIVENVDIVAGALHRISRGDFAAPLQITSHDEFGDLSRSFTRFMGDLRKNVETIVGLQAELQSIAGHEKSAEEVLNLVVATIVAQGTVDGARLTSPDGVLGAAGNAGTIDDGATMMTAPVHLTGRSGVELCGYRSAESGPFTDLHHTIFNSYAEFAALVIENHYSYRMLLERRNAQFQALQAQIRPHFLYNVLNNIVGLNRAGERDRLESSIFAMKDLLRASLDADPFVPLADEFRIAKRYCELQALRFDERFRFSLNLPDELSRVLVPTLILQPLIENAIIHGLEPLANPGELVLEARIEGGSEQSRVCIEVRDTGVGFSPEPLDPRRHIGLYNVRERLRIAYRNAGLQMESSPGNGTVCRIVIPSSEVESCAS